MTKSYEIHDQKGNLTHIREVNSDGSKSELYTAKDSLIRRITGDFKDEKVGIADHYRNGITREYEVRKGLSRVFLGEKGEEKPDSAKQKREPWEDVLPEPITEEPSSEEEWSDEVEERFEEGVANILIAFKEEAREERKNKEFEERMKRKNYEIEREQLRKTMHFDLLDRLYSLSDKKLEEKANYNNSNNKERSAAIMLQTINKISEEELTGNNYLYINIHQEVINKKQKSEDVMLYFIAKRFESIESKKQLDAKKQLEKILCSYEDKRYLFLKNNPYHPHALEILRTIDDTDYLRELYNQGKFSGESSIEIQKKIDKNIKAERFANPPWIIKVLAKIFER